MARVKVGFAICGSFCTFAKALEQMRKLISLGYEILPIMSFNAANINTRFGKAENFKKEIEEISSHKIINTIEGAEPIGPKNMVDIILVAPCTGNTLGKLSNGITDTPVTMAAKSQLRVQKPVLLALATNDALGASAQNIGKMLNVKNIFFVPMAQDDPNKKPNSLVADFNLITPSLELALQKQQKQPVFISQS